METITMERDSKIEEANQSKNFSVNLEPSKSDSDAVNIHLSGRLTIDHATEIHDKVEIAMVQFTNVNLILDNIEELDLSVVQLFFYLMLSADEDENNLSITHQLPDGINDLLANTGLSIKPNNFD